MTQILTKSTGGVLQIPAAATQKSAPPAPRKTSKPAAPRLKLLVRRLPPGLTQEEFETALGSEWKLGAGKVDWFQYKPGKISKEPARAYIHIASSDYAVPLADKVRDTSFLDSRSTSNDPVLLGPPTLEYAPYAKIPGSRVRKDARQGTIDQDPEFILFLESLTQPISKPAPVESAADGEEKKEIVTTTPLVQYIKEKKANKAKESSGKSSKHRSDKDGKSEKLQSKKLLQRPDKEGAHSASAEKGEKRSKTDKATKEAVKAANKAASAASKQVAKASGAQNSPREATQPAPERKRERGSVAAAARILQRDLGLTPSNSRRKGGKGTSGNGDGKGDQNTATPETSKKDPPAKPAKGGSQNAKSKQNNTSQPSEPSSAPRSEASTPAQGTSTSSKPPKSGRGKQASTAAGITPAPAATQAFLKHANPSQGVTELLLEAAFAQFGNVLKVEIDKKKGFGYIDFAEPDDLQKAIAASPVSVAQSQVVVLERKLNPGAEKGRGKGGRGEAKAANTSSETPNNRGGNLATEDLGGTRLVDRASPIQARPNKIKLEFC
ncbi:nonsense-mediated mRNA decay protein [Aspergillus ochraceoroseus]|uniref:Nonsense-mediated mRNA decay protein n=1 Tax=Aspergillus ochraceoroseus TaxID=138278 RepID=A0A0F8V1S6_9EURO|nr:nonsense-mediated mRNA decay protein [Aspergillus ochraceoroseus]